MEDILREFVSAYEQSLHFSCSDFISCLSLFVSIGTLFLLFLERAEDHRPHLQITFELIRGDLACIVLRNNSKVPLRVKNISFDPQFLSQIPDYRRQKLMHNNISDLILYPSQMQVLGLDVAVSTILNEFDLKLLRIDYVYCRLKRKQKYSETATIDFEQYGKCLCYVSEIDELKRVVEKILKTVKEQRDSSRVSIDPESVSMGRPSNGGSLN